jgi:hypothetical protein
MVKQAVTNGTAATAAQEPAVTPESVVESVRALRALIPNYVQLPTPTVRTLVSVSSLNPTSRRRRSTPSAPRRLFKRRSVRRPKNCRRQSKPPRAGRRCAMNSRRRSTASPLPS